MDADRDPKDSPPADGQSRGGRGNVIALVFVVLLAAFAVYIVNAMIKQVNLQNCILSGRKDCVEIVPGNDPR